MSDDLAPLGVYIHFPYCLQKCPYCDFVSFATERPAIDHRGYADAVIAELSARRKALSQRRLTSVFVGGGTPSLWEPEELGRVLAKVREAFSDVASDVEITAECNPSSLDEARAKAMMAAGVNRLSIGVQSLDETKLQFLGRLHDASGGLRAVRDAVAAGATRVSADLLYGVTPDGAPPSPEEAASDVTRVAELGIRHVSAYGLTIEPSTEFGARARKGTLPIAPDGALADAYLAVEEALLARGLIHYEISNYAVPGEESRHNLGYWRGHDYLGLGCAAVGALAGEDNHAVRYRNVADPERYMARARALREGESAASVTGSEEALDPETRLRERIMLGLRLLEGLDVEAAAASLGVTAWTRERRRAADRLVRTGKLVVEGGRMRVPSGARLFTDGTAAALF